jgi:hypothetical protein
MKRNRGWQSFIMATSRQRPGANIRPQLRAFGHELVATAAQRTVGRERAAIARCAGLRK